MVNYYAVVFLLRPPYLLPRGPFFGRKSVCNSQENDVRTRSATIVNHSAIVNSLRVVNLLRVVFLVRMGPSGGIDFCEFSLFSQKNTHGHRLSQRLRSPWSNYCATSLCDAALGGWGATPLSFSQEETAVVPIAWVAAPVAT